MFFKIRLKVNVETVVPTLYLFSILAFYIVIKFHSQPLVLYPLLILSLFGIFYLNNYLNILVSRHFQALKPYDFSYKAFFVFSFISFVFFLIWYVAYIPGGFNFDSFLQYSQAISNDYDDWHPVWHTLIFFKIPLLLSNNNIASIVFFQIIIFSLAVGYLCAFIYELSSSRKIALAVFIYLILNPFTDVIVLYPWKDVSFALAGVICLAMVIACYYKKDYLDNNWFLLIFSVLLVSATLFRHNGILFTAPLALVLLMLIKFKTWLKMATLSVLIFIAVKVLLYGYLNVSSPGSRVTETVGLPLTIITNVTKTSPDKIDSETRDFMYSVSTKENIDKYYVCGDFNVLKSQGINSEAIENKGRLGVLKLTAKSFEISPLDAFEALIKLTDTVYGFHSDKLVPYVIENSYGVRLCEPNIFTKIVNGFSQVQSNVKFLWNRGMLLFAVVMVLFVNFKLNNLNSWKKLALAIPLMSYNFGTMLLLTGHDSRFFFITYLAVPVLIFVFFFKRKDDNTAYL